MQVVPEAADGGVLGLPHPVQCLWCGHVRAADQDLDLAGRSEHILGVLRVGQCGHTVGEPVRPGLDVEERQRRPACSRDGNEHDQHGCPARPRHRPRRFLLAHRTACRVARRRLGRGVDDPAPGEEAQPDGEQDAGRERPSEVLDERHR